MKARLLSQTMLLAILGSNTAAAGEFYPETTTPIALGRGYDSASNKLFGACVDGSEADENSPGSKATSSQIAIELVDNQESMLRKTSSKASVGAKWGFGNASASMSTYQQNQLDSHSVYFNISNVVTRSTTAIREPKLLAEKEQLMLSDPSSFFRLCGDEFIYSVSRGGTLNILLKISTTSSEDKKRIEGAIGGSLFGASAAAEFKSRLQKAKVSKKLEYTHARIGGSTDPTAGLDTDQLLAFVLDFSNQVSTAPEIMLVGTRPYSDFIASMSDSPELGSRAEWLRRALAIRMRAKARADDFVAALNDPSLFVPFDSNAARAELGAIQGFMTQIDAAARACASRKIGSTCDEFTAREPDSTVALKRYDLVVAVRHPMNRAFVKAFDIGYTCDVTGLAGHWFNRSDKSDAKDCSRLTIAMNAQRSLARSDFDRNYYGDNSGHCLIQFSCLKAGD